MNEPMTLAEAEWRMWTRAPLVIPVALALLATGLMAAVVADVLDGITRRLKWFVFSGSGEEAAGLLGWYILPESRRRWRETWIVRDDDKTV